MIRKLKSGYIWEYRENDKVLAIYDKDGEVVTIPRSKVRSLGCMCDWVAWHPRERKLKWKTKNHLHS